MSPAPALVALALALGCAEVEVAPVARAVPGGVTVEASAPILRVSLSDGAGVPLGARTLPEPLPHATLPARWRAGEALSAEVQTQGRTWKVPVEVPETVSAARLTLEAPLGQDSSPVADGGSVSVQRVAGASLTMGLSAIAAEPLEIDVTRGDTHATRRLSVAGEHALFTWTLSGEGCGAEGCVRSEEVVITLRPLTDPGASETLRFTVEAEQVSGAEAAARLSLDSAVFPADILGYADLVRAPDQVSLPSPAWTVLLAWTGLGFRARDPLAPWAWQGVTLSNTGNRPVNAVVRARILDASGAPDPAFRPRMRDSDDGTGTVSVLLRVPANGHATAALPVFVDEAHLGAGPWTREVSVTPLGSGAALHSLSAPLAARRGSTAVALGLASTLVASAAGVVFAARGLRRWLVSWATTELTMIALFGALSFSVSAASQLVGMGFSALLGPFSAFLVGIIDDALRTALWAALITLLPRPGVATLSLLVAYLLRMLALGSMGPMDVLFTGSHLLWLELCLYAAGLTRDPGWRDGAPWARGLRLALGFGLASALSTASGLALSASFYRLFYAPWYAAALIALPGFGYSALAAVLAIRFSDALRRVEV